MALNRTKTLKILNPLLFVLITVQAVSGLLPSLIPYSVHRTVGISLVLVVGLHLILNWGWVRANFFRRT